MASREEIRAEAAGWVVRLSEDGADRAAFEAWRDADPAHEAAYEREAAAWDQLDRLRAFRPLGGAPDPDLFAPAPQRRKIRWAAAAGVALTLGLAATIGVTTVATPAYATGVGERRIVVLDDGTRVELNTNSKVVVRYRRGVREVKLVRGEAMFQVARDDRPFVVRTPDGRLEAKEAEVAVRLVGEGAAVTLREGRVETEGRAHVQKLDAAEVDRTLAWRQGAIALNGQSLAEAAAEFNRYNARQIVVDAGAADLRLGGYFQTSDLNGFIRAVTSAFPVSAQTTADGAIRLSGAG